MSTAPTLNAVTIAAAGGPIEQGGHAVGFNSPGVWVALSMLVVIGILLWKQVPAVIARALDRKIAAIKAQLDEATTLRMEAEAMRDEYQAKSKAAEGEAASIVDHARHEAAMILKRAKEDTEHLVERRARMAEDKIAAAERAAIAEIRARAAAAAAAAAATLIAEKYDAGSDKALVDRTIAGMGRG